MKDTLKYQAYKCKCGIWKSDYVWDSKLKEHKTECPECSNKMGYDDLVIKEKVEVQGIRTPTKNR